MKKILEMLTDKDADRDEIDARIWCYQKQYIYVSKFYCQKKEDHVAVEIGDVPLNGELHTPKYTTSANAAMSIGKEELKGWSMVIVDDGQGGRGCVLQGKFSPNRFESPPSPNCTPTVIRAICHARLQALDCVRGQQK